MPVRLANSVDIAVQPEQVFESFENADDWPVWAKVIKRVTWTSPKPFGLGTTRKVEMAGGMTGWEEFVAWTPGERMAFRFNEISTRGINAFGEDYLVEKTAAGCRVTWVMVQEPLGINRLVMKLVGPVLDRVLRGYLKRLKSLLEGHNDAARSNE